MLKNTSNLAIYPKEEIRKQSKGKMEYNVHIYQEQHACQEQYLQSVLIIKQSYSSIKFQTAANLGKQHKQRYATTHTTLVEYRNKQNYSYIFKTH